jgi:hypothetical protein
LAPCWICTDLKPSYRHNTPFTQPSKELPEKLPDTGSSGTELPKSIVDKKGPAAKTHWQAAPFISKAKKQADAELPESIADTITRIQASLDTTRENFIQQQKTTTNITALCSSTYSELESYKQKIEQLQQQGSALADLDKINIGNLIFMIGKNQRVIKNKMTAISPTPRNMYTIGQPSRPSIRSTTSQATPDEQESSSLYEEKEHD